MFIISLTYKASIDKVESLIIDHNLFLQKYYNTGQFITSGRKEPRTGGIILANANSKSEVEQIIEEDPFYIHQIADYNIIEFIPSRYNNNFKFFIKD
ncbi:GTP cyclohydrolase [Chryseobacterium glaciei]|uniref:GTP cyclohydrolase n=1 Tax=Chryseobacterium glaciei TaxID=1685010 RepID=A0A172XX53_9FLAO|nr:YciI family protein [Chryseobacterium glaciei]ANF51568.1 GTP cyclohydrolase [Chryseobacterium glaciei]